MNEQPFINPNNAILVQFEQAETVPMADFYFYFVGVTGHRSYRWKQPPCHSILRSALNQGEDQHSWNIHTASNRKQL